MATAIVNTTRSDLRKAQTQLFYDLIEKDNPGFQAKVSLSDFTIGVPQAYSASGDNRDTQVTLTGKTVKARGSVTVKYRRIDLGKLFRNLTLTLGRYQTASTWKLSEALTYFNAKYGLNLLLSDFSSTDQAASLTSGTAKSITIVSTSLCYEGTFSLTWTKGAPVLGTDTLTDPTLAGRVWPTGLLDTTDTRAQGEYLLYGTDCSGFASTFEAWTSGSTSGISDTNTNALVNYLTGKVTQYAWNGNDGTTTAYGLGNLTFTRYSLPNAALPEANSAKYNRAMVVTGNSKWFKGKFILHYNV